MACSKMAPNMLVVFTGFSGMGKTTLSLKLQELLGAKRIEQDDFSGKGPYEKSLKDLAKQGQMVIVSSNNNTAQHIDFLMEVFQGYQVVFVVPKDAITKSREHLEICVERIMARPDHKTLGKDMQRGKIVSIVSTQQSNLATLIIDGLPPIGSVIEFDITKSIEASVAEISEHINQYRDVPVSADGIKPMPKEKKVIAKKQDYLYGGIFLKPFDETNTSKFLDACISEMKKKYPEIDWTVKTHGHITTYFNRYVAFEAYSRLMHAHVGKSGKFAVVGFCSDGKTASLQVRLIVQNEEECFCINRIHKKMPCECGSSRFHITIALDNGVPERPAQDGLPKIDGRPPAQAFEAGPMTQKVYADYQNGTLQENCMFVPFPDPDNICEGVFDFATATNPTGPYGKPQEESASSAPVKSGKNRFTKPSKSNE